MRGQFGIVNDMFVSREKAARLRSRRQVATGQNWLRRPLTDRQYYAAALIIVFLSYAAVFNQSGRAAFDAFEESARNVLALLLVCVPTTVIVAKYVRRIGGFAELVVHCALAVVFALLWFFALMIGIGLSSARGWADFDVRPVFDIRASLWQVFQGLAVYAALATFVESRINMREALQKANPASRVRATPTRYFVRDDGDALPIDVERIILVRGADDYSEVVTQAGTHLVRVTLDRFERQSDPGQFCRIHRSVIVNVGHIERFEPDGSGRMLVWMDNGERLRSSRSGATQLRARMI